MPTYVYETVPDAAETEPRRFEVFQRMSDAPLTVDPDSGLPVRRLVTGGIGLHLKGLKRSTVVNKQSPAATACGCATGHHHHGHGHSHGHSHSHGHGHAHGHGHNAAHGHGKTKASGHKH